jgi:hypothetical protein
MNDMWRSGLVSLVAILMLSIVPSVASAGWRVIPTTAFVTDDLDLTLTKSLSYLSITSQVNGDQHLIYQTVPTVEGDVIDAIAVCYSAFDAGTFITAIGLTEFVFPASGTARHFDGTDLTGTDTCYVSQVANYAPAGAISLSLRLNFDAPAPSFIYIGAVAVHVK